eukprot:11061743-Heterocapsa_arctica.AAC.1
MVQHSCLTFSGSQSCQGGPSVAPSDAQLLFEPEKINGALKQRKRITKQLTKRKRIIKKRKQNPKETLKDIINLKKTPKENLSPTYNP